LVDSEVLRIRHLRVAAKRYRAFKKKDLIKNITDLNRKLLKNILTKIFLNVIYF